jgi:hypothetical protein
MIPSAYLVSQKSRVLFATMQFLSERSPVGPRTRRWDPAVIKSAVDRRKLILEHQAADEFATFFRSQLDRVKAAGLGNKAHVDRAIHGGRDALEAVYSKVCLDTAASYGPWVAQHLDVLTKADDAFKDPMVDWLRQNAASRVADINATTRERIKNIIADGTDQGLGSDGIASLLDDLYLEAIIPSRSMTIARTEVGNAANWASQHAATEAGVPMRKTWLSMGDEFVRDDHADADGQTVDDDEAFDVGGEQLQWPGDISLGASAGNVINCRCALTWATADE